MLGNISAEYNCIELEVEKVVSGSHRVIPFGYNSIVDSFRPKAEALLFVFASVIVEWEACDWVFDAFPSRSSVVSYNT